VTCPKGRDLVCIGKTHYGFCDEECAMPRRLKKGMQCADGKIFGVGSKALDEHRQLAVGKDSYCKFTLSTPRH
jgi:hypothetical protein